MDLLIGGGAYSVDAPLSVQECINLYPEVMEKAARTRVALRRFPGLKVKVDPAAGAVRGAITMAGISYFVCGTTLFEITEAGTATSIGGIAGTGRVSMAHNGATIVIVNGTDTGYTYVAATTTLSTISDTDFLAAKVVVYHDTYFVYLRTDTNQFFISAAGDATAYDALDFASKEGGPGLLVSMVNNHRDLVLAGELTQEFWRDTGNADFPFERQDGTLQERGCSATFSMASMDNSYYYLGDDRIVYTAVAYTPRRISHHAIEKWLAEQSLADIQAAIGFTMTWEGHYWYVLTLAQGTWVYDATTSGLTESAEWFQLRSGTGETGNWRVDTVTEAYGKILCGGPDGIIYELDKDTLDENGSNVLRRRATRPYFLERKRVGCPKLELVGKTGIGNASVTDPQVFLEISKDGGVTWHSRRQRSLGKVGEYSKQTIWRKNGMSYDWAFRWSVTDAVDTEFYEAYAEFSLG